VRAECIPAPLIAERRWVLWRYEWRESRWAKMQLRPSGHGAKSNDATTWTDFATALAAYEAGGFDGISFALGDGWAGIDADNYLSQPIRARASLLIPAIAADVAVFATPIRARASLPTPSVAIAAIQQPLGGTRLAPRRRRRIFTIVAEGGLTAGGEADFITIDHELRKRLLLEDEELLLLEVLCWNRACPQLQTPRKAA
jgi:hypothetical protein